MRVLLPAILPAAVGHAAHAAHAAECPANGDVPFRLTRAQDGFTERVARANATDRLVMRTDGQGRRIEKLCVPELGYVVGAVRLNEAGVPVSRVAFDRIKVEP